MTELALGDIGGAALSSTQHWSDHRGDDVAWGAAITVALPSSLQAVL